MQFLRKMWPFQLAFLLLIARRLFPSSLTLRNIPSFLIRSAQLISILFQRQILKLSRYFWYTSRSVQISAPYKLMLQMYYLTNFLLKFKCHLLVKRFSLLLNAAVAMATPDLILRVNLASFVIRIPQSLKYSTFSICFCFIIACTGDDYHEILITIV
jgi:hypothetical protein